MLQNKNLIWSDVCIWLKIFTAQTSSMQFRDSRSLSRSILNLQSLVREVLFKDVTLGPFHGGQEQRQVRSILDRHAHRWVIPISNSNFMSPKKNWSLVKFLGFKRLNLMFRLRKLDMRHPSWVGNQFILSGPNLCWQILGVKMLFEATSTTQNETTQNDPNTQHWAPGLLSTKVLQAKRVEQDLGRTKLSQVQLRSFDPLKMGIFLIDPVEGPHMFPLWIANSTAIFLQRKSLAFHRIAPLVCHNGHDPALRCRKTWKRRSVPVWFYASLFTCIRKIPLDDTLDGRNPAITSWGWWFIPLAGFWYISGGDRRISEPSTVCLCGRFATARTFKPGELRYPTLGKWKSS